MAEIQLQFVEQFAIKLTNGDCLAAQNSTF